jgi:hypothetical protein
MLTLGVLGPQMPVLARASCRRPILCTTTRVCCVCCHAVHAVLCVQTQSTLAGARDNTRRHHMPAHPAWLNGSCLNLTPNCVRGCPINTATTMCNECATASAGAAAAAGLAQSPRRLTCAVLCVGTWCVALTARHCTLRCCLLTIRT